MLPSLLQRSFTMRYFVSFTLLAIATGCNIKSSDATTTAASGKVPITTTSPDARALYLQGRDLFEQLKAHDAYATWEHAVAKDPSFAMAEYGLAMSSATAKDFNDHLGKAVALANKASDGERLTILSLLALNNGDPTTGQVYAESLVARYPQDERALNTLGNAYFAQQLNDKTIEVLKKAVAINPNLTTAYNTLGYAYRGVGDKPAAESAFQQYVALVPKDPNPHDSYGELLMSMGRFDESIAEYTKALALDPTFLSSHVGIAADHLYKGEHDAAVAETQKVYAGARDIGQQRLALFNEAVVHIDAHEIDQAVQRADSELVLDRANGDSGNMSVDEQTTGLILLGSGRAPDAARRWAHALALVVNSSTASAAAKDLAKLNDHFNRARVALAANDRATAHTEAAMYMSGTEALHNAFLIAQAHELNGLVALADKQFDTVLAELAKANQQNPEVFYEMALAYKGKGDAANAKTFAARCADMDILPNVPYMLVRAKAKQMT